MHAAEISRGGAAATVLLAVLAAAGLSRRACAQTRHWAFVPPEKHVPALDDAWCRDDIDRCVLAGLRAAGLSPSPEAERALLLRRAHLVLTGLPPSPDEVAAFVADASPDAYERRVDALLQSDACAEHLATGWLDLARFADTYGFQADFECRTWPWRDWLIRSFAADKPWDRFVREIVAGDLLPDATTETRTATAFWRLHRQTNEGGSIDEEWRQQYIADRTDTFGTAFLGLTVGCARCHDHKFDPISQRDYYALGSFFQIDEAGLYPYSTGATPQPAVRLTTPAQDAEIARLQAAVESARDACLSAAEGVSSLRDIARIAPTLPAPIARFRFAATAGGACRDERGERKATVPPECTLGDGRDGEALVFDGDARVRVEGLPAFTRDDAFSVRLLLWCPDRKQRAVVLHTSNYTEDADTQGYQVLLEHGHLAWQIVHHWPGSAIAVRMREELPLRCWCDVVVTYDGSSRAAGLAIFVDGRACAAEVVRDELAGPATVRALELGGRDRDHGFAGGRLEEFALFATRLSAAEVALLAGRAPTTAQAFEHAVAQSAEVRAAGLVLHDARAALHGFVEAIPELMVMAPDPYAPKRYVLRRGAYDQPDRSQPAGLDVPAAVLPWDETWPPDRRGLADWLNDPRHPLASRVVVDRLWALCFGEGLVRTPDDFGRLGERPAQQVLLDALACDFTARHSVRAMLRRIVCSATFRQVSTASAAQREADPHNQLLARGPSFRLGAEVLRDQALAASGLLQRQVGGPSCKPWQPPGLWRDAGVGWGADYKPDEGPNAHRRSLYTYRKRTAPPPDMAVLDAPSRETCVARRQNTDTPLQALVFLDDPVFTECAGALAARVLAELPAATVEQRLDRVFASLAARPPRAAELAALRALYETGEDPAQSLFLVASTLLASDAVVVLR
ncbi:MAG TPA: DUF1553 domain-containing protein [Planctomycetota bacterium]|nr:DUF1553 domain-containing protein [Planctomycetota bacterium]